MANVRKGDTVVVLAGKDRGKRGTVERVERTKRGLGIVIPGSTWPASTSARGSGRSRGGILDLPVPLHISNVQVVCPRCSKPTRVGHTQLEDGRRVRVCKHCGEQMEVSTK